MITRSPTREVCHHSFWHFLVCRLGVKYKFIYSQIYRLKGIIFITGKIKKRATQSFLIDSVATLFKALKVHQSWSITKEYHLHKYNRSLHQAIGFLKVSTGLGEIICVEIINQIFFHSSFLSHFKATDLNEEFSFLQHICHAVWRQFLQENW